MSTVSSSAPLAQAYDVAMLGKVKDMAELQGKATLELLDSATVPTPPTGTGTMVDDVA
ncbi:MAG: YjfB family protein [Deltaproteobacteria bacterium]|nr:YjfB family protein [Nannocystaceae bacterium]